MKLGISSHTFKWAFGIPGYPQPPSPLNGEKLIEKAASLGAELLQFGDNFPLHSRTDQELHGLRALSKARCVEIEVGTVGTTVDHLLRYLDIAVRLDASLVRSRIGTKEEREEIPAVRNNIGRVLASYEREGVLLVLENYETNPVRQLAELIAKMDHPSLGACLDVGNSIAALETPDMVVDALAPHALCLHIKDFRFRRMDHGLGYLVEGCPVGDGIVDVDAIFDRLAPFRKLRSVVLEQWTPYQGGIEETLAVQDRWVSAGLNNLRHHVP